MASYRQKSSNLPMVSVCQILEFIKGLPLPCISVTIMNCISFRTYMPIAKKHDENIIEVKEKLTSW